nr:MAG TPA: hypothetical protein [Caudoviricetes sp.]
MVEIVCSLISAVGVIVVAIIQFRSTKKAKKSEEEENKRHIEVKKLEEMRQRESRLSMDMMHSTAKLCIGTALAIKRGKANGELDEGLKYVNKSIVNYEKFLKDVTSEEIS